MQLNKSKTQNISLSKKHVNCLYTLKKYCSQIKLSLFCLLKIDITESQNGLGWKEPLLHLFPAENHMVPTPLHCHVQGQFLLDQVAHSPIQPHPEHFQGWGTENFSGQPLPVLHHPHHK